MDDPNARDESRDWEDESEEPWIFDLPKGAWERQEFKNRELRDRLLRNMEESKESKDGRRRRHPEPEHREVWPRTEASSPESGNDATPAEPPLIVHRNRERASPTWDDVFSSGEAPEHNPTAPVEPTWPADVQESPPPPRERPVPGLPPLAPRRDREGYGGSKWDDMFETDSEPSSIVDAMRDWVERSRARNQTTRDTPPGPLERQPSDELTPGPESSAIVDSAAPFEEPSDFEPQFTPRAYQRPEPSSTFDAPAVSRPPSPFGAPGSVEPASAHDAPAVFEPSTPFDTPTGLPVSSDDAPATFEPRTTIEADEFDELPTESDSAMEPPAAASHQLSPTSRMGARWTLRPKDSAADLAADGWLPVPPQQSDRSQQNTRDDGSWDASALAEQSAPGVSSSGRSGSRAPFAAQEEDAEAGDEPLPRGAYDQPDPVATASGDAGDGAGGDAVLASWGEAPGHKAPASRSDPWDRHPSWEEDGWHPAARRTPDPRPTPAAREQELDSTREDRETEDDRETEARPDSVAWETDEISESEARHPVSQEFDWRQGEREDSVLVRAFNAHAAAAAAREASAREVSFVELLGEGGDELVAEVIDPAPSRFATTPETWGQSYLPPVTPEDEATSVFRVPMAPDEMSPAPVAVEFTRPKARGRSVVRGLVETALLALLVFLGVRASFQNFRVDGSSMFPTLDNGEFLLVNKLVYSEVDMGKLAKFVPFIDAEEGEQRFVFHAPHRGDIVVLRDPRRPEQDLIKRVVGLPGETVEIRAGQVYINGFLLEEPYIVAPWNDTRPKITVPEGQYYVLGDNRNNSLDSRSTQVGLIPKSLIIGKAMLTYWPLGKFGLAPNAPGTKGGPELTDIPISEPDQPRTAAAPAR